MEKEKELGIEQYEVAPDNIESQTGTQIDGCGTVRITTESEICLIPTPTRDPRDPLNLTRWRKIVFVILVSIYSGLSLALVSGFGGLLGFFIPQYAAAGATYSDITRLMTFPTLFMGIGNIISMPLALSVGRRPVFLGSTALLVIGSILCATAKDYNWQFGSRLLLGLAAGQSEALAPMMVSSATQTILAAIYVLCASPIAGAITPGGWYGLGGGLSFLQLILSVFWVPESQYHRPLSALKGEGTAIHSTNEDGTKPQVTEPVSIGSRPELDYVNFAPRTLWSDMQIFVNPPRWRAGVHCLKCMFQLLFFPNVAWAFALNGLTIGVNIAIGTTYTNIMTAPPYKWSNDAASYVNAGQIVTALVALPLLGNGSDKLIKYMAKRRGGMHEPEVRLIPLCIPVAVGIISALLYGQGAAHPYHYHWFVYVFANAGYYFCFVGANIAAMTYLLDSYPAHAGPLLVIICAFRGFVSFGVSYGIAKFIETAGYDGSFGAYSGLTALFGLLGIVVYFIGKRIRQATVKWLPIEP
ncbi:MAG: hypothetical protein M1821_009097 [Bathelium mastoideum]|nr:MAG: hypothetical protein M1821_009097 [Bathelium mastoideum]